jgi:methyl-accepting chemotaxis protein
LGETYRGEYTIGDTTYYGVHFPLKDGSDSQVGIVSMSLPMTEVAEAVHLINSVIVPLLAAGIAILFVIFIALLLFQVILPLKKTATATQKLSENLNSKEADFTYQIPVKRRDEIGVIIMSINSFIQSLRGMVSQLMDTRTSLGNLHHIADDLSSHSEESVRKNSKIMEEANNIKEQTANQSQSLDRTNSVLKSASESLDGLNVHIDEQNKSITASSASVEEMTAAITSVRGAVMEMESQFKALVKVTDAGKQKQEEVDKHIQEVLAESETLVDANRIIAKIAANTNLLAMNAAIEAAHAGELGKGFSVVAEEIRNLAESSSAQSNSIKKELNDIVKSVNDTVRVSAESKNAFSEVSAQIKTTDEFILAINEAMTSQVGASGRIKQSLDVINTAASQVQNTSADLTANMSGVKKEMDELTKIVHTIEKGIIGMGDDIQDVNNAAGTVLNLAKDTQKNIKMVEETISSFKV